MLARAIGQGLLTPFRRPGLTFLLWAWGFLLVLGPAAGVSRWFADALGQTMASDPMLHGIDMTVLGQIGQYDRTAVSSIVMSSLAGTLLAGLLLGPFVAGGTLEVLTTDDRRSLMHRFFRGAGHFYWRYLRLGMMAIGVAGLLLLGITFAVSPLVSLAMSSNWEPAGPLAVAGQFALYGLALVFCWLALDYARIRVATDDSRVMWRALVAGAGFVLRRLVGTFAIALAFGVALAVLFGLYLAWTASATFASAIAVTLLFVVQQAVLVARGGLRLGQIDAELAYWRSHQPALSEVVAEAPAAPADIATAVPVAQGDVAEAAPEPGTPTPVAPEPVELEPVAAAADHAPAPAEAPVSAPVEPEAPEDRPER